MWVADMGFAVCPDIIDAMKQRLEHPILGYTVEPEDYYPAIHDWILNHHQWSIHRRWLKFIPGIVKGIGIVCNLFLKPDEKVIVMPPVYHPFFLTPQGNHREVVWNPLKRKEDGYYEMDFDNLAQVYDEKCKVLILCNPHNPCGRVWTKEELTRMNDICMKYGVKVVSDEIHCELIMPGYQFQPFAAVSEQCRQNSVILNSPSKSFNIAGLQVANIICSQPEWRRRLDRAININEVCDVNPFAPVALKAAYNESEDWLDELNQYLWGNYTFLCDFIEKNIPQWKVCRLEGTYLPWVDISAMGISAQQLCDRLIEEARVWINPGTMYGPETGKGYVRLNIACPRSRLKEALERIAKVITAG